MKHLFPIIFVLTAMLFTMPACKKGDQGPAGPQGQQGIQGIQGIQGPDGSKIYSGNGVPATTIGSNGDFYLDLSTSLFYGPKTSAGWGTAISLKGATGATGAAGAAGSKILSGTGVPAASLGSNGDYYLDKATYNLYGPKTAGAWGSPLLLRGPAGPQGPAGTANVIYSDWFTPATYVKDTVFNIWGFNYDKAAPGITQDILDKGAVITYAKLQGYNPLIWTVGQVSQMPITIQYIQSNNNYIDTWTAIATLGNLRIRLVNNLNTYYSINILHQFRYVIIPGGVAGGRSGAAPDYNDYVAVCRYYGIPLSN